MVIIIMAIIIIMVIVIIMVIIIVVNIRKVSEPVFKIYLHRIYQVKIEGKYLVLPNVKVLAHY